MEELKKFILENIVQISWGNYEGINDLTLSELYQLRSLVDYAINEYKDIE